MAASKTERQRRAFEFLRRHLESQKPFTKQEFFAATGWKRTSPGTYWGKHYESLRERLPNDRYRVSYAFRRYSSWPRFREHVTQVRRAPHYRYEESDHVRIYEFLLPLSNEEHLRATLDALFYRDTILARLRTIAQPELRRHFSRKKGEGRPEHLDRICDWLSERFPGYSVYHVEGRFRVPALGTRADVAAMLASGERYLVDETTAVARFIFPCRDQEESLAVNFFFHKLFVDSIIEVVNGQDQIWMVESGMRSCVHRWFASGD